MTWSKGWAFKRYTQWSLGSGLIIINSVFLLRIPFCNLFRVSYSGVTPGYTQKAICYWNKVESLYWLSDPECPTLDDAFQAIFSLKILRALFKDSYSLALL